MEKNLSIKLQSELIGLQMLLFIQVKMNFRHLAEGALRVLREEEEAKIYPKYSLRYE